MDIETFVRLADRQHAALCDAAELDGLYLDIPIESWKRRGQRRGWTRRDRRHVEAMHETWVVPPVIDRHFGNRVETMLRLFDLRSPIESAARAALAECERHPELAEVSPLVLRFTATHCEWLEWMRTGDPSDVDRRWEADRGEVWRLLSARGLLLHDVRKNEWDRWRELCSTAKRRELLDRFWLANRPVSKSEIDPDAGTGLRRMIGILNGIAAKANPRIPWMIRSDQKTQKWEKHWLGR